MKSVTVFLVVLVLIGGIAGVWAYELASSPRAVPAAPTTLLAYEQLGNYSTVTTLTPNLLYNTTQLDNASGPLFVPITRWVNVTFSYTLVTDPPSNVSLNQSWAVELSTGTWTKSLNASANSTTTTRARTSVLVTRYSINVSAMATLVAQVGNETGRPSAPIALLLEPLVRGSAAGPGFLADVSFEPVLNLTFQQNQITLSGLRQALPGELLGPVAPAGSGPGVLEWLPVGALAATEAGIVTFLLLTRRSGRGTVVDPLVGAGPPGTGLVVRTDTPPMTADAIRLTSWDDVVRVSETLKKPILWFQGFGGPEGPGTFWVRDGPISYGYFPRRLEPSGTGVPPDRALAPAPTGLARPSAPGAPGGAPSASSGPVVVTPDLRDGAQAPEPRGAGPPKLDPDITLQLDRLQRLVLDGLRSGGTTAAVARALLHRSREVAHRLEDGEIEGARILLSKLLDEAETLLLAPA